MKGRTGLHKLRHELQHAIFSNETEVIHFYLKIRQIFHLVLYVFVFHIALLLYTQVLIFFGFLINLGIWKLFEKMKTDALVGRV
jgi:hypothetical protein